MEWKCKQCFPCRQALYQVDRCIWISMGGGHNRLFMCHFNRKAQPSKMDRRLYQDCCLQLIHQFNTPGKYLRQNGYIFLIHSITPKSIWALFISNACLGRCPPYHISPFQLQRQEVGGDEILLDIIKGIWKITCVKDYLAAVPPS